MSGGKQEVESEEEKGSQDGCEESNSEDTNPYGFTFCNQSYLPGRIVQILQHGLLYGTSDADARKAVKDAQRRLTKYNLKQACTLEGGLQDTQNLIAGLCTVEFVSTGSYQRSSLEAWTYNLALTTAKYFATDYCAQNLKVIFYGIEQNAACAAHAFAVTFNRVSNLAADFVPKKLLEEGDRIEIDRIKQYPNTSTFSKKSRMAYRKDLVDAIPEASRWQQQEQTTSPAFVGASANWVRSGIAFVPVCSARSIWLEGVPKNKAMVKKYGYKAVKALALHSRKVWKAFLENKKWTVVGSRLKDPVLP